MKYECFVRPGFSSQDIEAASAESARRQFAELLRDNLEAEHIIANNHTDDGEDPSPNTAGQRPARNEVVLHPVVSGGLEET